jgi:peptidoglycan/LPS O-acetylase OafA/YrhL
VISERKYRLDIDGLRGLAVILVLFYHAFPNILSAGFIGVDIFFVISGYLISQIILTDLAENKFTFSKFYSARIRRIFPALSLVLLASLIFGLVFLYPNQLAKLASATFLGALFLSNFFIEGNGYFDDDSETSPFLHLWSLAVEEQFYLFWPLILFLAWKKKVPPIFVISATFLISFISSIFYSSESKSFFMPHFRMWEIMAGALVAQIHFKKFYLEEKLLKKISFLGFLMIILSLFLITKNQAFPSFLSLIPVAGTALIIFSNSPNKILTNPLLVWFGLISYPLYLWHWPILSLAKISNGIYPSNFLIINLLVLAIFLSWLTFKFIEKPIRFGRDFRHKNLVLLLMMFFVSGASMVIFLKNEFSKDFADKKEFLKNFKQSAKDQVDQFYKIECDFFDSKIASQKNNKGVKEIAESCYRPDLTKKKSVFLWGDCNAQQLNYGLKNNLSSEWQIMQVASSACASQIVRKIDKNSNYCERSNYFALSKISEIKPDFVILAQYQNHNFSDAKKIHDLLKLRGIKNVIFLGPTVHWQVELPEFLIRKFWSEIPLRTNENIDKSEFSRNEFLRKNFTENGLIYIDAISSFCNSEGCLVRIKNDIVSFDNYHLMPAASDYFVKTALIPKLKNLEQ